MMNFLSEVASKIRFELITMRSNGYNIITEYYMHLPLMLNITKDDWSLVGQRFSSVE